MVVTTMNQVNHEATIAEIVKHCQTKFLRDENLAAETHYKPPSTHSEPVRECVRTISNPTTTALTSMTTLT